MSLLHLSPQAEPLLPSPPPQLQTIRSGSWRRWLWAVVALWILSGIYIVAADEQAVVTRFGRIVDDRVRPGIHYSLPWPLDSVWKLKVQQLQRQVLGEVALEQPAVQFLTGDQNIIRMRVAVQYSVSTPAKYLFTAGDVHRVVAASVEAQMSRRVAAHAVDAVLTTEKAAIQEQVREAAQRLIDTYDVGVVLAGVNIESLTPPAETRDAFNDVASARADAARVVNEAQGYSNDIVPRARGEAQQMLEAAQAYRMTKINGAQGDAARFTQVAAEYAKASDVNGRRLYAETMEQVLPRIKKLVIDSRGNLDLTILRRGEASPESLRGQSK
ncbi:MAG: FtsH protease activity modulator HflK [Bryobacterales bacterium]|nr:FtsH protease activity modulator HflK [Bryobacterales bacterium]